MIDIYLSKRLRNVYDATDTWNVSKGLKYINIYSIILYWSIYKVTHIWLLFFELIPKKIFTIFGNFVSFHSAQKRLGQRLIAAVVVSSVIILVTLSVIVVCCCCKRTIKRKLLCGHQTAMSKETDNEETLNYPIDSEMIIQWNLSI